MGVPIRCFTGVIQKLTFLFSGCFLGVMLPVESYIPLCIGSLIIILIKYQQMANIDVLKSKLSLFNQNLKRLRKEVQKQQQSNSQRMIEQFEEIRENIDDLKGKFKVMGKSRDQGFRVKKLEKDFEELIKEYCRILEVHQKNRNEQVRSMRKTFAKLRQSQNVYRTTVMADSYSESEPETPIQMQEVNTQTLQYERMIEIKQKQLLEIKYKMEGALQAQEEVKKLVFQQGEDIDKIKQNVENANQNVKEGQQNLIDAKEQHLKAKKKKICIVACVFFLLLAVLIPVIISVT